MPGRYRCGFFTPPVVGADLRAAFVATANKVPSGKGRKGETRRRTLLARGFASGGLAGSLLGSSHGEERCTLWNG